MHEVLERITKAAPTLSAESAESDRIGRLTGLAAKTLKDTGLVRLLQPKEFAGYESHPNDFFEATMAVGRVSGSAGWVAGVVGVHPWEIAMMDPRLQEEIWGDDPDTWTASPYAPFGRATRVDGGFLFSGQWPYSTGTDHSQWVILGGIVLGDDGAPTDLPDYRHFVIPRADYEVVEDSWNVMGLEGTGSKDVRMKDVFVPEYRVVEHVKMCESGYVDRQPGKPLYQLGFGVVFSAAIGAATIGIAEGALAAYQDLAAKRVSAGGVVAKSDPHQAAAHASAAADIAASRSHFLTEMAALYDHVCAGGTVTLSQRLTFRRDQVRASRRAVDAVDSLAKIAGSGSVWLRSPFQRFWRDLHVAHTHVCNVSELIYEAWTAHHFGGEPTPGLY